MLILIAIPTGLLSPKLKETFENFLKVTPIDRSTIGIILTYGFGPFTALFQAVFLRKMTFPLGNDAKKIIQSIA